MSLIVECPSCRAKIEAERWEIEGAVSRAAKICNGKIETPNSQTTYWLCGATCPNCGEYFGFLDAIRIDGDENVETVYPRFQEEMQGMRLWRSMLMKLKRSYY